MKYHIQLKILKNDEGIYIPLYETKASAPTDTVTIPNAGEIKDGKFILSPLLDFKSQLLYPVLAEHFINHRGVFGLIKKNLPQMIVMSEEKEKAVVEFSADESALSTREKLVQEMMVL